MSDAWFEAYKVAPGVLAIYEPHRPEEIIRYLISGKKRAVLFDSGGSRRKRAKFSQRGRSPADEVNNLKFIAGVDHGLQPFGARHNLAVLFHGDAVPLQFKGRDQSGDGRRLLQARQFARVPVENDLHFLTLTGSAG